MLRFTGDKCIKQGKYFQGALILDESGQRNGNQYRIRAQNNIRTNNTRWNSAGVRQPWESLRWVPKIRVLYQVHKMSWLVWDNMVRRHQIKDSHLSCLGSLSAMLPFLSIYFWHLHMAKTFVQTEVHNLVVVSWSKSSINVENSRLKFIKEKWWELDEVQFE